MRQRWINIFLSAALVLAATSCASPDVDRSQSLVAPQATAVTLYKSFATAEGYTLLSGGATAEASRSATLSPSGGRLTVGANQITIPYGALAEPTKVTFTMVNQPYMAARLTAVRVRDGALVTQFAVPLPLKISYAKSITPIPDPTRLKIYYVVDGAIQYTMPTTVDVKGQALYTELNHFSEYSPGLDP